MNQNSRVIMIQKSIDRLTFLCSTIPPLLKTIDENQFSKKTSENKWSKKEILGHLIDSATNNHQRFVRSQFENVPTIIYDQNNWNKFNFYQKIDTTQIIEFWTIYNKQLIELFKHFTKENLIKECKSSDGNDLSIEFIINDYVEHLEHHMKQIVNY